MGGSKRFRGISWVDGIDGGDGLILDAARGEGKERKKERKEERENWGVGKLGERTVKEKERRIVACSE